MQDSFIIGYSLGPITLNNYKFYVNMEHFFMNIKRQLPLISKLIILIKRKII